MEPINFIRLRQDPPSVFLLGPEDTLGIFIEGVLGKRDEPPPFHFPEQNANIPPAIGYPMPIRDDGTVSLPLVPPIQLAGLTLAQAEREIRRAYTITQKILVPGRDRIIVTLIRPRRYQVLVVREDTTRTAEAAPRAQARAELTLGPPRRGATMLIELPAYQNDVLHALTESGGLPGVDAENEVVVLRGAFDEATGPNSVISKLLENPPQGTPSPNMMRIPLRARPGEQLPIVSQEDIILDDGDVLFIKSRDAEVFYTGGLLTGGQWPLPRDIDLDVLGGIAMSGGSIAAAAGGSGTVGGPARSGVGSIFPPTRVLVLRQMNGQQVAIEVDLRRAVLDPSQRVLIQPNDFILLEYRPSEVLMNVLLNNMQMSVSLDSLFN